MQANDLSNNGSTSLNGIVEKNIDDNSNKEISRMSCITKADGKLTTNGAISSVPPTKVDVEPINNKDGLTNAERHCDLDDIVTSPPIKLRIRQSFHDGTLDDGSNNGSPVKVLIYFINLIVR